MLVSGRIFRGLILGGLLVAFHQVDSRCSAQENSVPLQRTDCPKFTAFPPLPMSVVIRCEKNDSTAVTLPLKADAEGRAGEKMVRGAYDFREYRIPQVYTQEQAFDVLLRFVPTAGFILKYSARPFTITARSSEMWILINVDGETYTVAAVRDPLESCTPVSDSEEISRQMETQNRVAIFGIQFTPQDQINVDASSKLLEAILNYLNKNPTSYFLIEGHKFSTTGTENDDFEITRERANAVADWLIAHGIPAGNLQVKPFGRMQPITDNDGPAEIQCNDRIELAKATK
jgi:outer membrane protein OmpA-like peptidoglycan-associated protein